MFGELLFSFDSLKLGISYKVKRALKIPCSRIMSALLIYIQLFQLFIYYPFTAPATRLFCTCSLRSR